MSDQFLGEIRPFAGNFAPRGWALCNGQLLAIQQYSALFSLLGTYYGGNGTSNFQLPNIAGVTLFSTGTGPGLSTYVQGETGGAESISLTIPEIPAHSHIFNAASAGPTGTSVANETNAPATNATSLLSNIVGHNNATPPTNLPSTFGYTHTTPVNTQLNPNSIAPTGSGVPHENRAPFLTISYCIALEGDFPARN